MRSKKALRQLSKAEALISTVANRYTPREPLLQELLHAASAAIGQAKSVLDGRSGQPSLTSVQATKKRSQPRESETAATPNFTGSKTDFVRAVVEARGPSGATARDIGEAFTTRRINRSRNLIYNALSALVKQKKLNKKGDRYSSTSIDSNAKPLPPKKRISPEGLKRIREANKKRWAKNKAAQSAQATAGRQKASVGKKSAIARRAIGSKVPAKKTVA